MRIVSRLLRTIEDCSFVTSHKYIASCADCEHHDARSFKAYPTKLRRYGIIFNQAIGCSSETIPLRVETRNFMVLDVGHFFERLNTVAHQLRDRINIKAF